MFREMRRKKQQVTNEECVHILKTEKRGAIAVNGEDGYPYALPLDYYYDEEENCIYFHCAKEGHKMDAIRRDDKVCFTVWNQGYQKVGDWSYYSTSVIAFGRAELVPADDELPKRLMQFGMKYYPTRQEVEEEIKMAINRVQMVRIRIEHMTGKLVHEK